MTREELMPILIQASAFGLVLALWLMALIAWGMKRRHHTEQIGRRLRLDTHADHERTIHLWHDGAMHETRVRERHQASLGERLQAMRNDAGWTAPVSSILMMIAGTALAAALAAWIFTHHILAPLAAAGIVALIAGLVYRTAVNRRRALFERQLVDALDFSARSLRAGHPLPGAFRMVSQEIAAPVGSLFARVCERHELGEGLMHSLSDAAAETRSPDMKIFAASVAMQIESGGNLAEMIDRVARVIRERIRLARKARVLTAEITLSKYVLLALPVLLFLGLNVINPRYMEPLFTTWPGTFMLLGATVSMGLGWLVMNHMGNLKY